MSFIKCYFLKEIIETFITSNLYGLSIAIVYTMITVYLDYGRQSTSKSSSVKVIKYKLYINIFSANVTCNGDEFMQCGMRCIPKSWVCDGLKGWRTSKTMLFVL